MNKTQAHLLFLDHLRGQTTPDFRKSLKANANTDTHMGEKGSTDTTQAIDHTVGRALKVNMDDLYTEWTASNYDGFFDSV